jgi:hypothetical protein
MTDAELAIRYKMALEAICALYTKGASNTANMYYIAETALKGVK